MAIVLEAGRATCTVAPDLGGSLLGWTIGDQPMLRAASADAIAAGRRLGFASFPLVPFSNRIDHGRFCWAGTEYALTPNFPPEPHRIHGTGWEDAWRVLDQGRDSARLCVDHAGDDRWPFAFRAGQEIVLGQDSLELRLSAWNLAAIPVPLGFGHHCYFDLSGARMVFAAGHVWTNTALGLPDRCVAPSGDFDFTKAGPVAGRAIDNCYTDFTEPCRIAWDGRPLGLDIHTDLPAAMVYVPPGLDFFCFEPVPHLGNVLNTPGRQPEMPVIAPGEAFRAVIRFVGRRD